MNHIMIDLETLNNTPDSVIVAIGAVAFDKDSVLDKEAFYVIVDIDSCLKSGLTIGGDTLGWWAKQSPKAQAVLHASPRTDLETALDQLNNFIIKHTNNQHRSAKVWGNGAAFDQPILRTAYARTGKKPAWEFYNEMCYRTLKNAHKDVPPVKPVIAHHAAHDSLAQAKHLIQINKKAGGIYL